MNIRVSDIKQYFYCPRVVYHTYFTPVHRPTTHPMELGAVEHEVLSVSGTSPHLGALRA